MMEINWLLILGWGGKVFQEQDGIAAKAHRFHLGGGGRIDAILLLKNLATPAEEAQSAYLHHPRTSRASPPVSQLPKDENPRAEINGEQKQ